MTILPAKRPGGANGEENKETAQQTNNGECANRRRDDHSQIPPIADNSPTARRYNSANSERKDRCFKKRYKESDRSRDRERERDQKRETRREQKRDRVAKSRDIATEPILDATAASPTVGGAAPTEPVCNTVDNTLSIIQEDCSGFNSEDEYDSHGVIKDHNLSDEEWQARDELFARCIVSLGFEIKQMNEDGACLFRSIADQVYGDQELHFTVRTYCMDYIVKNKDYFAPYVTEDFDKYVARKRKWNVHGNHLEIQAMSEMYNRTIEVYCYQIKPINIFNGPNIINSNEPIRLSYHRMCHYNSISNPNNPSVGVGLGLPNYHTIDLDRRRFNDAMRASEELLIEQVKEKQEEKATKTMLEDKLKATDWEATNEAIEEQIARESYIQYIRDMERRKNLPSTSTTASTSKASPRTSRRGSVSPKGGQSPKAAATSKFCTAPALGSLSPKQNPFVSFSSEDFAKKPENEDLPQPGPSNTSRTAPPLYTNYQDEWCQEIMARVLDESRKTYLEELKQRSHSSCA